MGILGVQRDWAAVQWLLLSSTWQNPLYLAALGATQGKDCAVCMLPKDLLRHRLMSKMDFWSNYANASVLLGY